jgi:hypothetical protein
MWSKTVPYTENEIPGDNARFFGQQSTGVRRELIDDAGGNDVSWRKSTSPKRSVDGVKHRKCST